jgi:hypothetical protein
MHFALGAPSRCQLLLLMIEQAPRTHQIIFQLDKIQSLSLNLKKAYAYHLSSLISVVVIFDDD